MLQDLLTTIPPDTGTIAARLLLAAVLGAMIGLDRELKHRPLGLRTNMTVAIGSALFAIVAVETIEHLPGPHDVLRVDPTRVIDAVIQGIGFLGAGAIIQGRGEIVRGGTTGATIWALGGVGLACGFGLYAYAVLATLIMMFVLTVLGALTSRLGSTEAPPEPPAPERRGS